MEDPGVEGESGEKEHEETVPFVRFKEVNDQAQREKEARIRAEEQLRAERSKVETKSVETKTYTRQELRKMVTDESISQDQMDEYLEAKLRNELQQDVMRNGTERDRTTRVTSEISRYKSLVPDVLKEGTDDRTKVSEEYQHLLGIGQPATIGTELAALRSVFGPVEKLEKRKLAGSERETFQDVGNGDRKPADGNTSGAPKNLPPRYKQYYEGMIAKGHYSGWDDPKIKKELDRAKPEVLARRQVKYS